MSRPVLFSSTADVSVRPAVDGDAATIGAVQLRCWHATHGEVLGEEALAALDEAEVLRRWDAAISRPPGPGYAVLVACEGPRVVGFAAVAPGELLALEVDPGSRRSGHGSRLLAAAVDRLRTDGAEHVTTWVLDGDAAREGFLAGAGLGALGRSRALATGVREVSEHLWGASLG